MVLHVFLNSLVMLLEFWKRLSCVMNPEKELIDYIVLNHTEPGQQKVFLCFCKQVTRPLWSIG